MFRINSQDEIVRALLSLLFISVITQIAEAEKPSPIEAIEYRGGIRNSTGQYRLERKQQEILLAGLREKTGFAELDFAESGYLKIGNQNNFAGGSSAARKLLVAATASPILFNLENHNHSSEVSFARLAKSIIYRNLLTKAEIEVRPLIIDFSDYSQLLGDKDVMRSFDVAITVLHELVHGVYRLQDAVDDSNEIGECENLVNTIRRDLGLPERQSYLARLSGSNPRPGFLTRRAELQFLRTKEKDGRLKTEREILSWDAVKVGLVMADDKSLSAKSNRKGLKTTAAIH